MQEIIKGIIHEKVPNKEHGFSNLWSLPSVLHCGWKQIYTLTTLGTNTTLFSRMEIVLGTRIEVSDFSRAALWGKK